jgi:hypothetical protein
MIPTLHWANDLIFGEKLAHGIVVTFSSGVPSIHIRDTAIKPILESLRTSGNKISECIERYQLLSGITPSKAGFRVMGLVLRRLTEQDSSARSRLKEVYDEALAIDLSRSSPGGWKREIVIPIHGRNTRLSISVVPLSSLYRLGAQSFAVDIPKSERINQCGYKLEMRPEKTSGSGVLHAIKMKLRQGVAVAGMVAPMVGSVWAMKTMPLSELLPQISSNPAIQQGIVGVCECLAVVGTAIFSYTAHQYLLDRKITRQSGASGHETGPEGG